MVSRRYRIDCWSFLHHLRTARSRGDHTLLYEGAPAYPDKTHPWEIICESNRPTDVRSKVSETVTQELAAPICPVDVYLAPELPRTYSGKLLPTSSMVNGSGTQNYSGTWTSSIVSPSRPVTSE